MSGIEIRAATRADGDLVLSFIRDLAEYERLLDQVEASAEDIERVLFAANPRAFCEIAEHGGEPAGFMLWFYNFSTFRGRHGIYLEDLFVKPQFRGKGIGKALLAHLAKRAVAEGCARVEWWVLDWNEPSIKFYASIGAIAMEEWTVFRLSGEALRRLAK